MRKEKQKKLRKKRDERELTGTECQGEFVERETLNSGGGEGEREELCGG